MSITTMIKCTVISCSNYYNPELNASSQTFFPFPEDRALCHTWKEKCGISAYHDVQNAKVCAVHFQSCDLTKRNKLKMGAVPKEELGWMLGMPEVKLETDVKQPPQPFLTEIQLIEELSAPSLDEIKPEIDLEQHLSMKFEELKRQEVELAIQLEVYQKKNSKVQDEMKKLNLSMQQNGFVQNKGKFSWDFVNRVFSPTQIKFLKGRKKVVWSHDDMAMAFTLRHMGNRELYLYLKDVVKMPLPTLSAVQRWAASK